MGGRYAESSGAKEWLAELGNKARSGTYAEASEFGEIVFLCVKGDVATQVVELAGPNRLAGKLLADVSNPLDFSRGFPPALFTGPFESLGERVQAAAPAAHVVKALNTVAAPIMVRPDLLPGEHDLFVCGNEAKAKAQLIELLQKEFGWQHVVDVGGIDAARGTEALLPLWTRLYGKLGTHLFNFHFQTGS